MKHEILKRSIEIWTNHPHTAATDVNLKQFIGVYHAVMKAVGEIQSGLDKSDIVASLACDQGAEVT